MYSGLEDFPIQVVKPWKVGNRCLIDSIIKAKNGRTEHNPLNLLRSDSFHIEIKTQRNEKSKQDKKNFS